MSTGLPRFVPADVGAVLPAGMPVAPAGVIIVIPSAMHGAATSALRATVVTASIFAGQAVAGDRRWGTMLVRAMAGAVIAEATGYGVAAVVRLHNSNVLPVDIDWLMSYGPTATARMVREWQR